VKRWGHSGGLLGRRPILLPSFASSEVVAVVGGVCTSVLLCLPLSGVSNEVVCLLLLLLLLVSASFCWRGSPLAREP
jgi:hypothetical protein